MPAQDLGEAIISLGIALGLGLLVGMQRERAGATVGGFRTFALLTLLGAIAAQLAAKLGAWPFVAVVIAVAAMVIARSSTRAGAGNEARKTAAAAGTGADLRDDGPGMATEVAMLVMVCVGALAVHGPRELAVAIGGCVMVLLQAKLRLHTLAHRISDRDFGAIVRFALITLVILPVLPDRAFGPYAAFNPYRIWLMVVLIVGIDLGAYLLRKLFGGRAGLLLNGILGGLVSSTATTVSAAGQARAAAKPAAPALMVAVAGAVMLPRVAAVAAVVGPHALAALWQPLVLLLGAFVLSLLVGSWWLQREGVELPESANPAELRGAIVFALVFGLVLLFAAWAREEFGQSGVLVVAAISGLTDVDAITLSTAGMVQQGRIDAAIGAAAIVAAILVNTLVKLGIAWFVGGWRFFVRVLLLLVPVLSVGVIWFLRR